MSNGKFRDKKTHAIINDSSSEVDANTVSAETGDGKIDIQVEPGGPASVRKSIQDRVAALEFILELIGTHRHKLRGEFSLLADRMGVASGDNLESRAFERLDMLECVEPLLGKCIDSIEILLQHVSSEPKVDPFVRLPFGEPGGGAGPSHIDIVDQDGQLRRLEFGPEGYYRIPDGAVWSAVDDKAETAGTE